MKKVVSLIMVLAMMLSLVACGGGSKKAFNASKEAYDNISVAYEITEKFGSDIYEAWRMGIHDKDEILSDGVFYLAKKLSLSAHELRDGGAYYFATVIKGEDWDTLDEQTKSQYAEVANPVYIDGPSIFVIMEDSLFDVCVDIVTSAYIVNGSTDKAQNALDTAKTQMRELSEKYSDYEHYPNLKGYYTTTRSYFDFCQTPSGSFEQLKTTVNDYKNEARDYISDLDYIFEE